MQYVTLNGIDELTEKLQSLAYDVRYKGGRFALRKAAQLVRDAAKRGAMSRDDPGTGRKIAENIAERWNGRLYKTTRNLGFRVGVLNGAVLPKKGEKPDKSAGGPTPHWRLLEFGTEKMAARPFFVPALAQNAQAATDVFVREYGKAIDRALRRAAKKK